MKTPDVMRSVDAALEKTGLKEGERPKILSDNGPCYVSKEIKESTALLCTLKREGK